MQYRFYWKVWLGYSSSYYNDGLQLQLFINGVQNNVTVKAFGTNKGWSYEGTTGWYTVANKTSGTTPFYAKLVDTNTSTTKVTSSTYSLSVSGAASVLGSISNFDIGGSISIPITKYNSSFTDTLVIKYGSTTIKTVSSISNGSKVSFTSAELTSIYGLMSTVKSGTFTFALTTKNGSTTIGTSTKTATGSINNANPTYSANKVTYADKDDNVVAITKNNQHIVQNHSALWVYFEAASGNKGASIIKYTVEVNGVKMTSSTSGHLIFGRVNSSKNVTAKVTVTDSRGNTTTVTKEITVLAHSTPNVSAVLERLNNYEDTTYFTVNASVSSLNGNNTMTISYMKKVLGGTYDNKLITIDNNTRYTLVCDKNNVYVFYVSVKDALGEVGVGEFTLAKGMFPLFIDTKKNSVGINCFPSGEKTLEVNGFNIEKSAMCWHGVADTDANNMSTQGCWVVREGATTNYPSNNGNGIIIVFSSGTLFGDTICLQIFVSYNGYMWGRMCWYGTWYAWKQLNNS